MNPPAGLGTTADDLAATSDEGTAPTVDTVRSRHRDVSLHQEPGAPSAAFPSVRPRTDPDGAPAPRETMHDLSDHELGRIIAVGSVVGMLGIFVIVVAMCLVAGTTLGQAAGIATVPTFFGGWFYGGTILLLRAAYTKEPNQDLPAGPQSLGQQNSDGVSNMAE